MIKTTMIGTATLLLWLSISTRSDISSGEGAMKDTTKLKSGQKCPDFVFRDSAGKDVALSQFKGKYVYIDVWASWCYPCRKEYPIFKQLRERMKGKNIEFVGISLDTQAFRWKGALQNYQMNGQQWIVRDTVFMTAFDIPTIPRYILLDQEGKILNSNMSRPSKPETENILYKLKNI